MKSARNNFRAEDRFSWQSGGRGGKNGSALNVACCIQPDTVGSIALHRPANGIDRFMAKDCVTSRRASPSRGALIAPLPATWVT
jgi:hypothetical protein